MESQRRLPEDESVSQASFTRTNTRYPSYLPALKFVIAVSVLITDTPVPAGFAILILAFTSSLLQRISSTTIKRFTCKAGAH